MQFVDNEKDHDLGIAGKLNFLNCMETLPDDLTIQLIDANNNSVYDLTVQVFSDGTFYIAPEDVALLAPGTQYSFVVNYPYSVAAKSLNEWIYSNNNKIDLCALGKMGAAKKDTLSNHTIAFFPNPAQHKITFTLPDDGQYQVEIIDLLGKLHISNDISTLNKQLDVNTLSNGVYIVKIKNTQGIEVLTKKLLVGK